jgi:DNA-directed RNA polymerase specialized sigma24 family protein
MPPRESDPNPANALEALPDGGAARPENDVVPAKVTLAFIKEYIVRLEVQTRVEKKIATKVKQQDIDDVAARVWTAALAAGAYPDERALPAWLDTLTVRAIADHYREERRSRGQIEGGVDPDQIAAEPPQEPADWMIARWLARQVKNNPREQELFDILKDKARLGVTYAQIAEKYGMTLTALSSRIFQLKKKYGPRRRRYLASLGLLVLFVFVALVALAYELLRPRRAAPLDTIGPEPLPTVTASTPPTPSFDQAVQPSSLPPFDNGKLPPGRRP